MDWLIDNCCVVRCFVDCLRHTRSGGAKVGVARPPLLPMHGAPLFAAHSHQQDAPPKALQTVEELSSQEPQRSESMASLRMAAPSQTRAYTTAATEDEQKQPTNERMCAAVSDHASVVAPISLVAAAFNPSVI